MTRLSFLTITLILTLLSGVVLAANPADLTSNHRLFVCEFYKLGYDDGPRFACVNLPVNGTVNATIFNWQNKKSDFRLSQLIIAKQFSSWLDGAVDVIFTGDSLSENVIADVHWNILGLGIMIPLEYGGVISIGPRVSFLGLTAFATLPNSEEVQNIFGATYNSKFVSNASLEVAYSSDDDGKNWFVRVSRCFETPWGKFIPESRNKFAKDEKSFGFAIGFIPN